LGSHQKQWSISRAPVIEEMDPKIDLFSKPGPANFFTGGYPVPAADWWDNSRPLSANVSWWRPGLPPCGDMACAFANSFLNAVVCIVHHGAGAPRLKPKMNTLRRLISQSRSAKRWRNKRQAPSVCRSGPLP
jgi:hypothetical protein